MRALAWLGALLLLGAGPVRAEDPRADDPWFQQGRAALAATGAHREPAGAARNLILFLGDGMGPSTVTAARILEGQRLGGPGEDHALAFESLPHVGLVKVYNTNQQVPDSAGTMTAIVSGVKTRAGILGLDASAEPFDHESVPASRVPTLFEEAEERGLATGLVTTSRLTHATPAACYAHAPSRFWEDDSTLSDAARADDFPDLARQLVEFSHGDGIDVMLGGGRAQFRGAHQADPEDEGETGLRWDERDLAAEWQAAAPGRAVVETARELGALPPETHQVLGLFDASHMAFATDRPDDVGGEPSLPRMTEVAIRMLARDPDGYVLMVEGGRIDHGHHAGNAYRALEETVELAAAVRIARELTDPAETLIVVTADHSHPLTLAGYATRGNPILGRVRQNEIGSGLPANEDADDGLEQAYTTLQYAMGPGHHAPSDLQPEGSKRFPHEVETWSAPARPGRPDLSTVDTEHEDYLQTAAVPRFSGVHSGEDVAVYAGGPGAWRFSGVREQSYLYHAMVAGLGWWAAEGGHAPPSAEPEPEPEPEHAAPASGRTAEPAHAQAPEAEASAPVEAITDPATGPEQDGPADERAEPDTPAEADAGPSS